MRRAVIGISVLVLAAAACSGSEPVLTNRFGDCTFAPGADCHGQDLGAVNIPATDLTNANFSDTILRDADLRNAILREANLSAADLSGADLTGADLRGANLTDTILFEATMDRADWAGSIRSGTRFCNTLLPDGTVSHCREITDLEVPEINADPPIVVNFAPRRPIRCLDDAAGEGIEVDWKVRDATSVIFLIDDVQASSALGTGGIKRLPFSCDDRPRRVTIQAFGAVPPSASASFSVAVAPPKL